MAKQYAKPQVWFRGNKAAQKHTEAECEEILLKLYEWVKANEDICLRTQVEVYALETFGIPDTTLDSWHTKTYKDNINIGNTWKLISKILENRVVLDQEKMRPQAQALVMQTKHNYREKKEAELNGNMNINVIDYSKAVSGD